MQIVWCFDEATRRRICRRKDSSIYGIAANKKCRVGTEDVVATQRHEQLSKRREEIGRRLMTMLLKKRPDGQGTEMEHPTAQTLGRIEKIERVVKGIDQELNRLEGRPADEKRWVNSDPYGFGKFSDWGQNSAARQRYEKQVMEAELAKGSPGKEAILALGGPAAGKSSAFRKAGLNATSGYFTMNPDNAKEALPEYLAAKAMGYRSAAAIAHENSSRMAKAQLQEAMSRGIRTIVDGTGANRKSYDKTISELKANGFSTQLIGQHVDSRTGIARAMARANREGRYVPREFIEHAYKEVPKNWEHYAKQVDKASLNNSRTNRTIARYENGKLVESDSRVYSNFLSKYAS